MKLIVFFLSLTITTCSILSGEAIPVQVKSQNGHYFLFRDGKPYFIHGAGGKGDMQMLREMGGNSFRTWGNTDIATLDKAHELGLSVCVGLWIAHERHGIDYSDPAQMEAEIAAHKATIDQLKDHPAVLLWGIGNEVEIDYSDKNVWRVVEAVAAYAKKVDPNHPTMTVTAHVDPEVVKDIIRLAPSIDILGVNTYGGITVVPGLVQKYWPGPYIITEWGTNGPWEVDKTSWGAQVEQTSTAKADLFGLRYSIIASDRDRCLGSYAFTWGSKQETTATWFGVFISDGTPTEVMETLSFVWRGKYPPYRAPRIAQLKLNKTKAKESLKVQPGSPMHGHFMLLDGGEVNRVRWQIFEESDDKRKGGDKEEKPEEFDAHFVQPHLQDVYFNAPETASAYRLFLYVYGEDDKTVATANFPFYVE